MAQSPLNAFNAVFIPTFLSIIGVIFYLRLGYIVGGAGMFGTILIILLAVSVTFSTALALSSITTNIRIGQGGAYSIVSKTLGLEVGGSVGIPLYLAQVFSVALYIFGFVEVWKFIFPTHPSWIVLLCSFASLLLFTTLSVKFALKIQLAVFFTVILSLVSVFASTEWLNNILTTPLVGRFPDSFWELFALFFPAVTGLMAGIGLSGELEDARRQIPLGVLSATGVTTVLYIVVVFWLGHSASPGALSGNNLIMVELAAFGPLVIAGMLAATYSSALTTFIAAPRLLSGMANKGIVPWSGFLLKKTGTGIPLTSTLFTAGIILLTFTLGGLNQVAPVLTIFFLITYSAINIVVFVEQTLGLPSFRPRLNIPKIVPLYGAAGSIIFMFLINPAAALLALVLLVAVYLSLVRRKLVSKEGDVRSGLFMLIAEWAAKMILKLPESAKHVWKPNILFPAITSSTLRGNYPLLRSIVYPNGTLTVLGMEEADTEGSPEDAKLSRKERQQEMKEIKNLVEKFGRENIFTSFSDISVEDYTNGICVSLEAIEGQVFHPNILFLPFKPGQMSDASLARIYRTARKQGVGLILFSPNESIWLGSEEDVKVWVPDDSLKGGSSTVTGALIWQCLLPIPSTRTGMPR